MLPNLWDCLCATSCPVARPCTDRTLLKQRTASANLLLYLTAPEILALSKLVSELLQKPCGTAGKGTDAVNRLFDPSTYRRIFGGNDCLQMPDTLVSKCRGSKDHEFWCALLLPLWAVVRCGDRSLNTYTRSRFNGRDMLSMICFDSLVVLIYYYGCADKYATAKS